MIKNPEQNLTLTDANLLREQKVKARLDNIVREVDIYSKKLQTLTNACEKTEKEKNYLEDEVYKLHELLLDLNSQATTLRDEISNGRTDLEEIEQKSKKITDHLNAREDGLKVREVSLQDRETVQDKRTVEFNKELEKVTQEKILIEKVHSVFSQANDNITKAITW